MELTKMKKQIINCETGEIEVVDMTPEEIAELYPEEQPTNNGE
jgi:hypothetical protein